MRCWSSRPPEKSWQGLIWRWKEESPPPETSGSWTQNKGFWS